MYKYAELYVTICECLIAEYLGPQSRPLRFIHGPEGYKLTDEEAIYERGMYIGRLKNLELIFRTPYHNEDDETVEKLLQDMDRDTIGVSVMFVSNYGY